jgi:hypothetical protein
VVALGKVLLGVQPQVLGSDQGLVAMGMKDTVLPFANGVERLGHVFHDVEPVEDDLVIGGAEVGAEVDLGSHNKNRALEILGPCIALA